MVSFDVVSLFTKVPVEDSLSLLSQHFTDILALFKLVLTSTYFCINDQYFEQTDGVGMGRHYLQLSQISSWRNLKKEHWIKPPSSLPAGTDMLMTHFVIWPHGEASLTNFLEHLNGLHKNIQFTMEKKKMATYHSWI
jgi:hypothetical protein